MTWLRGWPKFKHTDTHTPSMIDDALQFTAIVQVIRLLGSNKHNWSWSKICMSDTGSEYTIKQPSLSDMTPAQMLMDKVMFESFIQSQSPTFFLTLWLGGYCDNKLIKCTARLSKLVDFTGLNIWDNVLVNYSVLFILFNKLVFRQHNEEILHIIALRRTLSILSVHMERTTKHTTGGINE